MTGLFDNATFGTLFQTRDGGKAVYLAHIKYNDSHKLFVQGLEFPLMYNADGKRRPYGRYSKRLGPDIDIIKMI